MALASSFPHDGDDDSDGYDGGEDERGTVMVITVIFYLSSQ